MICQNNRSLALMIFLASIPYDAYCSMMEYILESAAWNPYDHIDMVQKRMATNYLIRKEEGDLKKDCLKGQVKSRIFNLRAADYRYIEESRFDDSVQNWDITMDQLEEAYKTTAMERHLSWNSDKTYEKRSCKPFWTKKQKPVGDFMRRIFWLYLDNGNFRNMIISYVNRII